MLDWGRLVGQTRQDVDDDAVDMNNTSAASRREHRTVGSSHLTGNIL